MVEVDGEEHVGETHLRIYGMYDACFKVIGFAQREDLLVRSKLL